jgi:hypothetical protein
VRRSGSVVTGADAYLDVSAPIVPVGVGAREPVGPIPMPTRPPRSRPQPVQPAARPGTLRAAGQLPTFERAYLVEELRRIAITAGGLLGLIIILALVLR